MAKILTEAETYAANVTVPEGGDARTALSVEAPFQVLADRLAFIRGRLRYLLPGFDDANAGYGTGFSVPLGAPSRNSSDRFVLNADFMWAQADVTDEGQLTFHFSMPQNGVLQRMILVAQGGSGNAVAPLSIGNSPILNLHRVPILTTSGADEVIATIDYNTAGAPSTSAGYKAAHAIATETFTAPTLSTNYNYFLTILGEDDANAAVGWMIRGVTLEVSNV